MIVTEFYKGQGLGNQLWCYVVTRAIAKKNGYEFGIKSPLNFKGSDFMNLDFGKDPSGIIRKYEERAMYHPRTGADVRLYDGDLVNVADDTEITGVMQDENYIIEYKNEIREWLKINDPKGIDPYVDENICIINFRGGEYARHPEVFLEKKYWQDAIVNMLKIRADLKFVVITDDEKLANEFFPDIPVPHLGIAEDYAIISRAKYLILSNSSFAWFPAWLSSDLKFCIAPKYWARHNVSDGYWSTGYNLTRGWMYQDINGMLSNYETCLREFEQYQKTHPDYFVAKSKNSNKFVTFIKKILKFP